MTDLKLTIEELQEEIDRLKILAFRDELTGVGNRSALNHGELNAFTYVYLVDLDGLKEVNDTLGHEAGDDLILKAATFFSSLGQCFRLGGDEFAIFSDVDLGQSLLHRPVRFSVGTALATESESVSELLALADARMYEEKKIRKGI